MPDDGVVHAQRLEHVLGHPVLERRLRHTLHDEREQPVARVVVVPLGAGRVLQLGLTLHDADDVVAVDVVLGEKQARHRKHREIVAVAARVREQVAERDRFAEVGKLGDVLADIVIERESALIRQQRDGEGGELLRGRRDVGRRVDGEGDAVGEARHAIGPLKHDLAMREDADSDAGGIVSIERGEELVDGTLGRRGSGLGTGEAHGVAALSVPVGCDCEGVCAGRLRCELERIGTQSRAVKCLERLPVGSAERHDDVDGELVGAAEDELAGRQIERVGVGVACGDRALHRLAWLEGVLGGGEWDQREERESEEKGTHGEGGLFASFFNRTCRAQVGALRHGA